MRTIFFSAFQELSDGDFEIIVGDRTARGKWLVGGIIQFEDSCVLIDAHKTGIERAVYVIPETVSQFTGMFDKNNRPIYENDVVLVTIFDGFTKKEICSTKDLVVFDDFKIGVVHGNRGDVVNFSGFCNTTFEVIGTKFDAPTNNQQGDTNE